MKLEDFLKTKYGYNPEIKDALKTYIDTWNSWYQGNVKKFHQYFIYNGQTKVKQQRYTMNMAKEISEDWSDILWSEKCKIAMNSDKSQEQFDDLVDSLDLYYIINQVLEKSGALGTSACVVSAYDIKYQDETAALDTSEAKVRVDIVDVDNIYPLSWNNKEITECAFGSVLYMNGERYVVCSVHKLNDKGNYVILNHLFKDDNGMLSEVTAEQNGTFAEFDTQGNIKWFTIFKPMLTNNLFSNSPFGIPHFANAIDNLKSVDIAFDTIQHEINTGKRRLFARADMFNYDENGRKLVFDPNDANIYQLPGSATKDDLIQSESEDFRTDKLINSLNTELNILGSKVGFGENHYHFDGTNLSTATAVVSSNSKLFRRKKKLEIGYESAIYDLCNAISYVATKYGKYNIDTKDMAITFDDSIVEDKESESARALRELNAGVLGKVEYRVKIFGETEEIAQKKIDELQEYEESIEDIVNADQERPRDEKPKEKQEDRKEEKENDNNDNRERTKRVGRENDRD